MDLYNNKITRRTNLWIRNHLIVPRLRKKLCNRDATILCNNCTAGFIYHDFGMEFRSPTINLFYHALDFFEFVEQFDYYINQSLIQIPNPRYDPDAPDYPVAILSGDAVGLKDIL